MSNISKSYTYVRFSIFNYALELVKVINTNKTWLHLVNWYHIKAEYVILQQSATL